MKKLVTFGEIMARFEAPVKMRLTQAMPGQLSVTFAGAEANVAVTNALLGAPSAFVSVVPNNPIGLACISTLRAVGIDTSNIIRGGERLGLYFLEHGANQRPSQVVYDRSHSAIVETDPEAYDWQSLFAGADWFHISGITPALSANTKNASVAACREAKALGLTVSCDLNYRGKLWNWDPSKAKRQLARETMAEILPNIDILIGNEGDAEDMLGIRAGESDVERGRLEVDRYAEVARQISERFKNLKSIAFTLRESLSATHNRWGAMLYDVATKQAHYAPDREHSYSPYEITDIVDRVGAGDSFSGALVYALREPSMRNSQRNVVAFATAASALCHSIHGDFNFVTKDEVLALVGGDTTGRVKR